MTQPRLTAIRGAGITAFVTALLYSAQALAALPTPVDPSTGAPGGNWLELVKGYIKDGGIILGLTLSVVGFLWISWIGLAKFNEARQGRTEWGEVGLYGIAGGALLLFVTFLLNEATQVIT